MLSSLQRARPSVMMLVIKPVKGWELSRGTRAFGASVGMESGSSLLRVACCNQMVSSEINTSRMFPSV